MKRDIKAKYYIENVEEGDFDDSPDLPDSIPSIKNFVGREDYLKGLRKHYENGERSFVLYGTGGVGKTATTLKFAGEITDKYKAKIFVDMQGTGENPLSADEAMFIVVRTFEPQISADIPPPQLKGLFVSLVQRQPTLIVLDNAESEAQLAPLINVKDACVLVSSRNNIQLTSGETVRLRAMSTPDAENLLFSIAGEQKFEGKARELAELGGCLPMALKPLAKLLKKEFWTITRILKEYADRKKLLDITDTEHDNLSVEASFGLSYDALTEELKKHWRTLAVFPADFESNAASTVFGLEFEDGWNVLEQLYDYSLIEQDAKSTKEEPRFNIHDLAREFADKRLCKDERFAAQFRHAFYYTLVLRDAADTKVNDQVDGFSNALKLIDKEWNNIITGQKWTADFIEKDTAVAELCTDYAGFAPELLTLRLHIRHTISFQKDALKAAKKLGYKRDEANCLGNLGIAYRLLGEYEKAIEFNEGALTIAKEIGDWVGEGSQLGNLGAIYHNLGEYRKSIEYLEIALTIFRKNNYLLGEGATLGNLGNNYRLLDEYWKAIEHHEDALAIAKKIGNLQLEAHQLANIGNAFRMLGEFKHAIDYSNDALNIFREIDDLHGEGVVLSNLGLTYKELGEKEQACDLWREALSILEAIESPETDTVQQYLKEFCES